jgi:O-antigen/teichoic acid export membrane protein
MAGVASTGWTAVVTIATVPLYLHYLGIEAYGLVGFFTALQTVLAVLELGLAQSVNREVARAATADERARARDLLHTLAAGYWAAAAAIAAGMWAAAPWISRRWLSGAIDPATLSQAVMLMGLIAACRFPLSLYLGAMMGARRMGLASGIEMAMVTVANLGAVAILGAVSPTIQAFFVWQALVAVVNVAVVRAAAWRAVEGPAGRAARFDLGAVRGIWRFSAGVAVTALLGCIFVQGDKLVLGKLVGLADLGRYTLASIAARSLYVLVAPAFSAVYPQMATLHAAGRLAEVAQLYRSGTRLLMAALFPAAAYGAMFSTQIFTLWTGDAALAESLSVVIKCLLLGTALNGAMHFPYALQLAFGKSSLPVLINIGLLVVFAPLLVLLTLRFGVSGAAAAWAILNTLYLLLGSWLTHRELLPGIGLRWLGGDVGAPLLTSLVIVCGGALAIRPLNLGDPAALAMGLALAGLSFLAVFPLSPGLAEFARRTFAIRPPLLGAKA